MSAYVVNKSHINALVLSGLGLVWYHEGKRHELTLRSADRVGQMLLDECVKSVSYRYPDDEITELPGPTDAEWLVPFKFNPVVRRPTPVQALKLLDCYEYQSCEHPGWQTSEAKAFCDVLRRNLIHRLPGYDEAPWEWEDKLYYENTKIIIF